MSTAMVYISISGLNRVLIHLSHDTILCMLFEYRRYRQIISQDAMLTIVWGTYIWLYNNINIINIAVNRRTLDCKWWTIHQVKLFCNWLFALYDLSIPIFLSLRSGKWPHSTCGAFASFWHPLNFYIPSANSRIQSVDWFCNNVHYVYL